MYLKVLEKQVAEKLGVKKVYFGVFEDDVNEGRLEVCFGTDEDDTYSHVENLKKKNLYEILSNWMTSKKVQWWKQNEEL